MIRLQQTAGVALCFASLFTPVNGNSQATTREQARTLDASANPIGSWHGVVQTPMGKLTLVFRFRVGADSAIAGDMESVDQAPGQRMSLGQFKTENGRISFAVTAIGATYEAEWNGNAQQYVGTFRQGTAFPLSLARGMPAARTVVSNLDGVWRGVLPRNGAQLRLVLRVSTTSDGTRATLDSPDLAAFGLPIEQLSRAGDSVRFYVPSSAVSFDGVVSNANHTLSGRWSRSGQPEVRVVFELDSAPTVQRARSQWPLKPAEYRAEEVRITNRSGTGVTLVGTLTIPRGNGPFPAAILISGSGPQDRDESVFGHRPFAVLADHLARNGIAVLRYDDRGFGASTGDHAAATSSDFALDANAAHEYLLTRTEIDRRKIGFVGHSEGGMIAPVAARDNNALAFLVLLAGPGTSTTQLALSQRRLLGMSVGVSETKMTETEPLVRRMLELVRTSTSVADADTKLEALLTPEIVAAIGNGESRASIMKQNASPWMRYFLNYDANAFLSRLDLPILAVNGSLDRQVPAKENLPAIRRALRHNRDATVLELPGLNHMFQNAKSGAMGEYADIAETFSPVAMDLIVGWLRKRFIISATPAPSTMTTSGEI